MSAVSSTQSISLFAAEDVRIDVEGGPACDGSSFTALGSRVLVLGAPRALFDATTGLTRVVRGSLTIRGVAAADAVDRGVVAGAPHDLPLPPRWTVTEYVEWSARLAGVPAADARASAEKAIARLQLGPLAKTETAKLVPHARRATLVAAALATGAEVIVLDDPLGELPDEVVSSFATVLVEALADRAWIVFAPRMALASPLTQSADEAIVLGASRVEAQGTPADLAAAERRYVARLDGRADAVLATIQDRGGKVEVRGSHIVLELGHAMTASEVVAICDAAAVTVIELLPVARAFT